MIVRLAALVLALLAGCAPQVTEKNTEASWLYHHQRNAFEERWRAFVNALSDAQTEQLGAFFRTGELEALEAFERSLDDLRRFKFTAHVDMARLTEEERRAMIAKQGRTIDGSRDSLFDKIEIVPGKPTHLPEPELAASVDPSECLEPADAFRSALEEGRKQKAANPLPPDRKEIEEIPHRLHPVGFARHWEQRATRECVTTRAIEGR